MKKSLFVSLLVAGTLVLAASANATMWVWHADLDGLQETPPNASPGAGFVDGTLDDATGAVVLTAGSYSGLVASITASHIHGLAPPGTAAGVLIPLSHTGGTSGTLSGGGTLSAANTAGMLAGMTYVNVHSSIYPGGEIRGQIGIVPEPATMLGLLGGSALLILKRRRR